MAIAEKEMRFQTHFDLYRGSFTGCAENDAYFKRQAEHQHALSVWSGSQDLISAVIVASENVSSQQARYHLKFGLSRRTRAIWYAFRELYYLVPPDRKRPLSYKNELHRVSEILNAIYINIKGSLDNFAWCFREEIGGLGSKGLRESQISLFNPAYLNDPNLKSVKDAVSPHSQWHTAFKKFRDPATHKVPLSAIPSIQDKETLLDYREQEELICARTAELFEAARRSDHARVEALDKEVESLRSDQERIGKFRPLFEYDPGNSPMPIYPTVPEDVGEFVIIARKCLGVLNTYLRSSS